MTRRSEFVSHILDLLAPLAAETDCGDVSARSMFGGWGIYAGGTMFGLIASDVFYLKTDDISRPEFESHGLLPFTYTTENGKRTVMSYHRVPDAAMDASEPFCLWARKGIAAAARAKSKPKKRAVSSARRRSTR